MKKTVIFLIAGIFIVICSHTVIAGKNNAHVKKSSEDFSLSNYILGPGDKLEIKVYRNDELSFTQQIDSSGKISYPLLGTIQAAGLTPYALKIELTHGLSKFFKDPQVMINVT